METAYPVDYDIELQRHTDILRGAWNIGPRDHVLDIGCGAGQTTRDAGRLAYAGSALGVDISAPMIKQAQMLTAQQALSNVAFERGDAAVHPFPLQKFDIAISRFGTMFFADPTAAFNHLALALRRGGRLTMIVWQAAENNAWATAIRQTLTKVATAGAQSAPDAFSLGDPDVIGKILYAAGFVDVDIADIREPVFYGASTVAALDWVCGFSTVKTALQRECLADRERVLTALRHMLAEHDTGRGVWFDSRAWLVAARRA